MGRFSNLPRGKQPRAEELGLKTRGSGPRDPALQLETPQLPAVMATAHAGSTEHLSPRSGREQKIIFGHIPQLVTCDFTEE